MRFFVSYARQDVAAVGRIKETVEGIGEDIWFDRELKGGQKWWDVILEQIRTSDAFLFALSPNSAKSVACRTELEYANRIRRRVLPIMVNTVDPRLFPEDLARIQYTDFREATLDSTLALVKALNHLDPAGALPDPLPAPPPVPFTYEDATISKLEKKNLTLKEQQSIVANLESHLDDIDDRPAALELLRLLRRRNDVFEVVARDIDRHLAGTPTSVAEVEVAHSPAQSGDLEATPDRPEPPGESTPASTGKAPKVHRFVAPAVDTGILAIRLENWLASEQLQTQVLQDDDRVVIQAKTSEGWKRWMGAGVAFTVSMHTEGRELLVEIGQTQWKDKAAATAVGLFVAWPVLIPAAFGAARQKAMPEKALRLIERSIADATPASRDFR